MVEFERLRQDAKKCRHADINRMRRGAIIGLLGRAMHEAAGDVGLEFHTYRLARLKWASEAFDRVMKSFNELSDGEMLAISWMLTREQSSLRVHFGEWLKGAYGEPVPLPGMEE